MSSKISIGLPRIHMEAGERRDFLPEFVTLLERHGAQVVVEHEYGAGMGFTDADYLARAPGIRFSTLEDVYRQDCVLVLRYPGDEIIRWMRPGASLISMLHFPTRPQRVELLRSLGIEAISLDSIRDDTGRRLVENLRAVAWNGTEVAFDVLQNLYPSPEFESVSRPPIQAALLGAGAVGMHAMQAAIRYGDDARWKRLSAKGVPGVQLTVVDHDLTGRADLMQSILRRTDLLIDATQRLGADAAVIPNEWIGLMPPHAVLLDLSVDPYDCDSLPQTVKGIEGVPQGNLDQYIFPPDDPAYAAIPDCVNTRNRRYAVSCYSWPGLHPRECMDLYGKQIAPLMRTLIECGGIRCINPNGSYFQRAVARAMLSRYTPTP